MSNFDFSDFPSTSGDTSTSSPSSSSFSSSSCQLSPHDRFFSSLLTAVVGSIITGISAGWLIAFCTAWISWFATTRILVVGLWYCYQALRGNNLEGGTSLLRRIPLLNRSARLKQGDNSLVESSIYTRVTPPSYDEAIQMDLRQSHNPLSVSATTLLHDTEASAHFSQTTSSSPTDPSLLQNSKQARTQIKRTIGFQKTPPSFLGWLGWLYAVIYFPVVQILWLVGNWSDTPYSGIAKVVRALAIGLTALPLTIDTKARYAIMLERRYGRWANRLFTFLHAIMTTILAILSFAMLISAIPQADIPHFFIPVFVVFSIIWMFGSFALFPPVDGGMPPNSVPTFFAGLAMGIFGGAFTGAPSFVAMTTAPTTPGVGIRQYLQCESTYVWEKFVAIFP